MSDRVLTTEQRIAADRRGRDGSITSLVEARVLLRDGGDRLQLEQLVTAVYMRGLEVGSHIMIDRAMDVAREAGFINRLVAPIVVDLFSHKPVNA